MKTILILVNDAMTLLHFRTELVRELVLDGNRVIVSVPKSDRVEEIKDLGVEIVFTELSRHGKNPFKDLKLYRQYKRMIKTIAPDIVLTFTIKPNVYGARACGKLKVPCIVNITGLGAVVENKGLMQKITLFLHKHGLKRTECVFFQNKANRDFFEQRRIVGKNAISIPGSGVNIQKFSYMDYPSKEYTNFVFVGRLIKVKGIFELASAAKRLEERTDIQFTIVGETEFGLENPFYGLKNVRCVGFQKDVRPYLKDAHAIVLPAYHEGLANVLLEGAACGRAIIATRVHGCEETFDEGITGFGCDAKNIESLKNALVAFADLSYDDKIKMGYKGRKKVEAQYDRKIVIQAYKNKIEELTKK